MKIQNREKTNVIKISHRYPAILKSKKLEDWENQTKLKATIEPIYSPGKLVANCATFSGSYCVSLIISISAMYGIHIWLMFYGKCR